MHLAVVLTQWSLIHVVPQLNEGELATKWTLNRSFILIIEYVKIKQNGPLQVNNSQEFIIGTHLHYCLRD